MKQVDWTLAEQEELKKMWLAGQSARQIGAALKRSRSSVIGKINRMGLSMPDPKKTAREKAQLFGFFASSSARGCQFIAGDPRKKAKHCGEETLAGSSYCEFHHKICYRNVNKEIAA